MSKSALIRDAKDVQVLPFSSFDNVGSLIKKQEKKDSEEQKRLKSIVEQFKKQGFDEGFTAGFDEGVKRAEEESAMHNQLILNIAHNLNTQFSENDKQISEHLLSLALDIAKAMLKHQLKVNDDVIIPIVRDALKQLSEIDKPAKLLLHKEDAAIVKSRMEDELNDIGIKVVEDSHLERGDCLIETATNEVDATNHKRWERISSALGKSDDWYR